MGQVARGPGRQAWSAAPSPSPWAAPGAVAQQLCGRHSPRSPRPMSTEPHSAAPAVSPWVGVRLVSPAGSVLPAGPHPHEARGPAASRPPSQALSPGP